MHCSTAQGRSASPLISAALQNRLTACLCHCNHTYGDCDTGLQCCNTNALHHWSGQNSFPTVQCCSAYHADSRPVSLQIHLWRFALNTGVQCCNTNALQHWSVQNRLPQFSVQLCKTSSQQPCVPANTPMGICSSYSSAVMQHQCTAALVRAK